MTLRPKKYCFRNGQYNLLLFRFVLDNFGTNFFSFFRRLFWIGWTTGITYTYLNFPVILIIKGDFPEGGHNFG